MKWFTIAGIIFAAINVSVQKESIFFLSKDGLGFNKRNPGEFFKAISKSSENCNDESKTVFLFEITTGERLWSYVEFTSPMEIKESVPDTYANATYIRSSIDVLNDGPCQIDLQVYVRPV